MDGIYQNNELSMLNTFPAEAIVTFFPSHVAQYRNQQFDDLYTSVCGNLEGCATVWDLYALLVKEATTHLFNLKNRKLVDLVETYKWVTSKKVIWYSNLDMHEERGALS